VLTDRLDPARLLGIRAHHITMATLPDQHPLQHHELELVAQARARDADAFAGLVLLHGDRLHRLLVRMLGDQHDAEEVAQEVLMRAWRGLPAFQGDAQFSTWLYRIAVNEANRRLERDGRARTTNLDDAPDMADEPRYTPPAVAEAHELRAQVVTCVEELPAHYRAVIALVDMEGRDNDEAARMLEIGVRNLKSRLHRARMTVRRCVETMMR
jgi:RNA polymerase sigma-70 factor (ECF subfamily)